MKITRKVATRMLKRRCIHCGCGFRKGNVYYLHRDVFECDGKVYSHEHLECAKCNYKRKDWEKRYEKFKEKCNHPDEFVILVWDYMSGEAVMQPDYDLCTLCGNTLQDDKFKNIETKQTKYLRSVEERSDIGAKTR